MILVYIAALYSTLAGVSGTYQWTKMVMRISDNGSQFSSFGFALLVVLGLLISLFVALIVFSIGAILNKSTAFIVLGLLNLCMVPIISTNVFAFRISLPVSTYLIFQDEGCTEELLSNGLIQEKCKKATALDASTTPEYHISFVNKTRLFELGLNLIPLVQFFVLLRQFFISDELTANL